MAAVPNAPQLDPGSIALLKCQLEPGEQLLWTGKPQWWRNWPPLLIISSCSVVVFAAIFSVLRLLSVSRDIAQFVLLFVGYAGMFGARRITVYNIDRDSLFGLTNRRAIRMWPLHSVALINDQGQPVSIRRRMFGRVTIGDTAVSSWNGVPRYIKPGTTAFLEFFAIPHPDEAEQVALEAQRRELQERTKLPAG